MTPEEVKQLKTWLAQNGYAPAKYHNNWLTNPSGGIHGPFEKALAAASSDPGFLAFRDKIRQISQPPTQPTPLTVIERGDLIDRARRVIPGPEDPRFTVPGPGGPGEETPEEERPEQPTTPLPEGWEWVWDDNSQSWIPQQGEAPVDLRAQEDLRAELRAILEQFGLATPGNLALIEQAVREDWSETKFLQELRQSPDYLANPLFAANLERARQGNTFLPEGQVIAYATEARRIAQQFGYDAPSDNYLANGFLGGLSLAEIEHRFRVQDRVNQFGAGVGVVYREVLGVDPTDQDLYEIFDKEISTDEIDDALRRAEFRGRPFTLGFGIRTEAEARAFEMLGVSPDEAFGRFVTAGQASPGIGRLAAIEGLSQNLPGDFGQFLGRAENQHLLSAFLFPGTPEGNAAMAQLQQMFAREFARFRVGGGPALTQGGQAAGLLTPDERARL